MHILYLKYTDCGEKYVYYTGDWNRATNLKLKQIFVPKQRNVTSSLPGGQFNPLGAPRWLLRISVMVVCLNQPCFSFSWLPVAGVCWGKWHPCVMLLIQVWNPWWDCSFLPSIWKGIEVDPFLPAPFSWKPLLLKRLLKILSIAWLSEIHLHLNFRYTTILLSISRQKTFCRLLSWTKYLG